MTWQRTCRYTAYQCGSLNTGGNIGAGFFDGWDSLLRTFVAGLAGYVLLVMFLRISGKRTLSKMNAFDLIVNVALGSTLATVMLSHDVPVANGALALILLIALQFIITWASVRMRWVRQIVTGEPVMLLYRGEFLSSSQRRARVTDDEVRAAVRERGMMSLQDVEAVVLETDGSLSVVRRGESSGSSSLAYVKGGPG